MKKIFLLIFLLPNLVMADSFLDEPSLFDTPTKSDSDNYDSFYKDDGSLVIIKGAKDSGRIIRSDDSGSETEYYVIPSDEGNTFIYDDGLTICNQQGCY